MKKNTFALVLFLMILGATSGGGVAYAKGDEGSTHTPMKDGEPMQSRNKRQKTRQFTRKAAAVRLRTQFQQIRANEIANDMHDYSKGQNQHGGSK